VLYHWYEFGHAAVRPARVAADSCRMFFSNPFNPLSHTTVGRHASAACEVFERTTRRYAKPSFGISSVAVDGVDVAVSEEVVWQRPFCRLIRFNRDLSRERSAADPRILILAPMSGHYATLLRGTVEALLPDHEVFITDWQDARHVPLAAGSFDLDDYIIHLREMLTLLGGDVHVFAVCQPAVPALATVALMEEDGDPNVPRSLILAGGPVDTRISPTVVNELAQQRGTSWFGNNVVTTVPWPCAGHGRSVYPGFLQLSGFMTMNLDRHLKAHKELFMHLVRGDGDSAEKHREFYDEYLAVMDLASEFFLQTIDTVFVRHALPNGTMEHRGRRVDLTAIRRTALMTIEGEKDDITGLGQCRAAIDLCSNIPAANTYHYECAGVGHYGVFNGSRFRSTIVPRITQFVRTHDPRAHGIPVMPAIDYETAAMRAHGGEYEVSATAFTFAAANDTAPDPLAQKLKARGLGVDDAIDDLRPQTMPFQLFALAGNMFIEQFFGMPGRPLLSEREERRRTTH